MLRTICNGFFRRILGRNVMRLRSDLVGTHPKFSKAMFSLGITRSAFSQGTFVSLDAREGLGQNVRRLCFDLDWYSLKVFKQR